MKNFLVHIFHRVKQLYIFCSTTATTPSSPPLLPPVWSIGNGKGVHPFAGGDGPGREGREQSAAPPPLPPPPAAAVRLDTRPAQRSRRIFDEEGGNGLQEDAGRLIYFGSGTFEESGRGGGGDSAHSQTCVLLKNIYALNAFFFCLSRISGVFHSARGLILYICVPDQQQTPHAPRRCNACRCLIWTRPWFRAAEPRATATIRWVRVRVRVRGG